ncbi:MHYT domain-containing protein [Bordetella hinzii]|uniref:MHYT domain-containing protein n=1 Tax=Bordetella hinzii TaxID=103855 RepID=UPI0013EFF805|nr:MHYT domain-containing protein [Bordetella hinzii]QII86411.1 signal protein [Bordetella hinzii]
MNPGDVVPLSFQMALVTLSFVIAFLGAYVALSAAARIRLSVQFGDSWRGFVVVGAVAMGGIGIWGMHFIGMQAQYLPFDVTYSLGLTILSALVAIGFSAAAFLYVGGKPFSLMRCLVAGVTVGLAVAAMHYIGMSAIHMPAVFRWNRSLVALSVLIAILAATVAIWLAFNVQREWQRVAAAGVMAVAICGMHYTGAAAGVVVCRAALDPAEAGLVGGASLPYVAFAGAVAILIAMRWQMHRSYKDYQLRMAARVDDLLGSNSRPAGPTA